MKDWISVSETTSRILALDPDPVVCFRLKRDVLHTQTFVLADEKIALDANPWVRQLIQEQHFDGGWGRFHSRDSTTKQKITTTEFGVNRGLALGLDASHPAFCRIVDYLAQLLSGQVEFPDRAERNNRWPLGVELFCAATLCLLKPNHPFVDDSWDLWAEIARRTFENGNYDPKAEILAHHDLTGVNIENSYLVLNNKYTLTLLSARADDLPEDIASRIMDWVWCHPQGVRYLGVTPGKCPINVNAGTLDRWFSTHELLCRFSSWRDLAEDMIDWLMNIRGLDGLWDFGSRSSASYYFPLSPNWRKPINRKVDWSIRVLNLLSQFSSQ